MSASQGGYILLSVPDGKDLKRMAKKKKSPESGSCEEENGLVRSEVRGHDEGTGKRSERQQEMK